MKRQPVKPIVPTWDLPRVLQGLQYFQFEPLKENDLDHLSAKVAFLVAITSAKCLGVLGALRASTPLP